MAGAGYKLFNTGDVLTAAQVNTYLMEQTVMVFANSTARTTALSGVLAEGMISYLQDTNAVQVYNGSAWVNVGEAGDITAVTAGTGLSGGGTSGDVTLTNTVATTFDAKGDLVAGTGADTFAKLTVGANGTVLTANSATTTGLEWTTPSTTPSFLAGKNKIINGDFYWNQRSFTSNTINGSYNFDRWFQQNVGTYTVTPQTFTLGSAPVAGYEGRNFLQAITSGHSGAGDVGVITQRIEDVRTFANQTITVSFWARANTGTPKIGVELVQNFGSGGSPTAQVSTPFGSITLSTSWARYSVTAALPSIAGTTLGTNANTSYLELNLWQSAGSTFATRASSIGIQNFTASFWGVQVEAGSVATPFTTATGTLAGELAACQRYYLRYPGITAYTFLGVGYIASSTLAIGSVFFPTAMRVAPTSLDYSTIMIQDNAGALFAPSAVALLWPSTNGTHLDMTISGGTGGRPGRMATNNSTSGFLAFNAEL